MEAASPRSAWAHLRRKLDILGCMGTVCFKTRLIGFFLVAALLAGNTLSAQGNKSVLPPFPDTTLFESRRYVEGNDTLSYRLYRSVKAESATEAVPLVVFLHGAGERGNDNTQQLLHCIRFFLADSVTSRYPFLLLVPQCPNEKRWVNTDWTLPEHQMEEEPTAQMKAVFSLIDCLNGCGVTDANRVYICGISMGGFGVWDALQRRPETFAAAIAICGGGDPAYAEGMKDTPVYIFHGKKDKLVKPIRSEQMYKALRAVGNTKAVFVSYPEAGHLCWDKAFSTPGIFKWLFGHELH